MYQDLRGILKKFPDKFLPITHLIDILNLGAIRKTVISIPITPYCHYALKGCIINEYFATGIQYTLAAILPLLQVYNIHQKQHCHCYRYTLYIRSNIAIATGIQYTLAATLPLLQVYSVHCHSLRFTICMYFCNMNSI